MDRSRMQSSRYQRPNTRNCYQQNATYSSNCGMNYDCNKSCNRGTQYCADNMENCPSMKKQPVDSMSLAMGYVPWQRFENLYEECEAVYHGTIFCDLDLDFCGMRCE